MTAVWVPDAGSEALRDLVREREAAKQDQLRVRHRLSKFLLRSDQRPTAGLKAWTQLYMAWARQLRFEQADQESTRLDYLHEAEYMTERVLRLEQAIAEAVKLASPELQEVIRDLQALRGIAQISAVTIDNFPHVSGKPFILAIADFQAPASMTWSREGLRGYLYGEGAQEA